MTKRTRPLVIAGRTIPTRIERLEQWQALGIVSHYEKPKANVYDEILMTGELFSNSKQPTKQHEKTNES